MQRLSGLLRIAVTTLLLASCATTPEESMENSGFVSCPEQRPQICTREYQPVCGHVDTRVRCVTQPCPSVKHQTYSNGCTACADPSVMAYELGSCESFGKGKSASIE